MTPAWNRRNSSPTLQSSNDRGLRMQRGAGAKGTMKVMQYPAREKDRWEHVLTRPLRGLKFEMLELMRMDLFEYLDVLTTSPYDDRKSRMGLARDLRRVAARLAELTPHRAKALGVAFDAGRVEYCCESDDSAPSVAIIAMDAQKYWERAARTK